MTLLDVCAAHAANRGGELAYVFLDRGEREGATLSFAELWQRSGGLARGLAARCAPGDRVLLCFDGAYDFVLGFFACLRAGLIAVPTYPPDPVREERSKARMRGVVRDAEPAAALASPSLFPPLQAWTPELTLIAPGDLEGDGALPSVRADDVALLQYTSGSTGAAKGVMVTHGNLMHNLGYFASTQRNAELPSRGLTWLPSYHDAGLVEGLLQPAFSGFVGYVMLPQDFVERPMRWLEAISRYRITNSGAPNFAYELCLRHATDQDIAALDLSCWRFAYNAAEPVRASTLERFTRRFAACGFRPDALMPVFGLAETTLLVSSNVCPATALVRRYDAEALQRRTLAPPREGAPARTLVGLGRVHGGVEVAIVEPGTKVRCPADAIGEIWVRGPSVTRGYWRRAEATRETFGALTADGDGPFLRTGDLGFIDGGELFVAGRVKDIVIVHGENHYPQDIEETVERAHPCVRPGGVAAFSVEGDEGETLALACELRDKVGAPRSEIERAIVAAVSAEHALPVHGVVFLPPRGLPKTSSGKVQRGEARRIYLGAAEEPLFTRSATAAERDVFLWQSMNPESPAACFALAMPMPAPRAELERVLAAVQASHPVLRCRFRATLDGIACAVLAREPLPWRDPAQLDAPFDLSREPPWRVAVGGDLESSPDGVTLELRLHHVAFDERAVALFLRALAEPGDGAVVDDPEADPADERETVDPDAARLGIRPSREGNGVGVAVQQIPSASLVDVCAAFGAVLTRLSGAKAAALGVEIDPRPDTSRAIRRYRRIVPLVIDPSLPPPELLGRSSATRLEALVLDGGDGPLGAHVLRRPPRALRAPLELRKDGDTLSLAYDRARVDAAAAGILLQATAARLGRHSEPALAVSGEILPATTASIGERLAQGFAHPERCALRAPGRDHSYAELAAQMSAATARLRQAGIAAGDVVALFCDPTPASAACLLALWHIGAIAAPLDVDAGQQEVNDSLARLAPRAIIRAGGRVGVSKEYPLLRVQALVAEGARDDGPPASGAGAIALRLEKGRRWIDLSHAALLPREDSEDAEVVAVTASWHRAEASAELLLALCFGRTAFISPQRDQTCPMKFAGHVDGARVTRLRVSPFRMRHLCHEGLKLPHVRRYVFSGDVVTADLQQLAETWLPSGRCEVVYALEALAASGCRAALSADSASGRVGLPMPGVRVRIVDSRGDTLLAPGVGEVLLETAAAGAVRTGDRGYLDEDGALVLVPRPAATSEKVRGQRVYLDVVEAKLLQTPGVKEAAAAFMHDARGDRCVIGWVVAEPGVRCKKQTRHAPDEVLMVDTLPRDAYGRPVIADLPLPEWLAGLRPSRPLSSPLEHAVARWFRDVLRRPEIAHADIDFFLAGGDSLLALRLVQRAQAEGHALTIPMLREARTIAKVAAALVSSS